MSTETDKKHTPTPWHVRKARFHFHIESEHSTVCSIHGITGPDVSGEADASHIVHCVNSHASLVAALEKVLHICNVDRVARIGVVEGTIFYDQLMEAHTLLSRVRKGEGL